MIDSAAITVAMTGIRFIKETFGAVEKLKLDAATSQKIVDANTAIGSVQDLLYQLREELISLQTTNQNLTKQLAEKISWDNQLAKYTLITTVVGGTLYQSIQEPRHFMCPSCVNKHQIQILQYQGKYAGAYGCPECKNSFAVNNPDPINYVG